MHIYCLQVIVHASGVILITVYVQYRPYMDKLVGVMCNPRLCMAAVGGMITYSFQVFFKVIAEGSCEPNDLSDIEGYLSQLSDSFRFVVCPGIREYPPQYDSKPKFGQIPSNGSSRASAASGTFLTTVDRARTPKASTAAKLVNNSYMTFISYNKQPKVYLILCAMSGSLLAQTTPSPSCRLQVS